MSNIDTFFKVKALKDKLYLLKEIVVEGEKWRVFKKNSDTIELAQFDDDRKLKRTIVRKFTDLI